MKYSAGIAAFVLGASLGVSANAATYGAFDIDETLSTITVTNTSACLWGGCATLTGTFRDYSQAAGSDASTTTDSLIDWTITGEGMRYFDVVADIVLSEPVGATGSTSGDGSFSIYGSTTGLKVEWDDTPAEIVVGDYLLEIRLSDVDLGCVSGGVYEFDSGFDEECYLPLARLAGGSSTYTSGASFTYTEIAAVPLPASIPLLGAGLGMLGLIGRRRKKG